MAAISLIAGRGKIFFPKKKHRDVFIISVLFAVTAVYATILHLLSIHQLYLGFLQPILLQHLQEKLLH